MIINNTKDFKEICKTILLAIDTSEPSIISETLELVNEDGVLTLSVTNREYFVSVKLPLPCEESFRATVNALLFLKLIFQLTTDTLELTVKDNALVIKADGVYKLPLIFNGTELLELPKIVLNNVTTSMTIPSSVLSSILQYNTRELQSAKVVYRPAQKLYYVDGEGAITYTTGACVNSFTLEKPIKMLLPPKVVKLFKLFGEDIDVNFALAQDVDSEKVLTKVNFNTDLINISATIPSDTQILESVPVAAIRNMSTKQYDHSVLLEKDRVVKALSRLLLFKDDISTIADIVFTKDCCVITYSNNEETIGYNNEQTEDFSYSMHLNIETLKNIIEGSAEDYFTMNFGDHKAVVIIRQDIKNIIPEWIG